MFKLSAKLMIDRLISKFDYNHFVRNWLEGMNTPNEQIFNDIWEKDSAVFLKVGYLELDFDVKPAGFDAGYVSNAKRSLINLGPIFV